MTTCKKIGWMTTRTKDGKQVFSEPFYATNPRYIEAHKEWVWEEIPFSTAINGMVGRQLPEDEPGIKEPTQ